MTIPLDPAEVFVVQDPRKFPLVFPSATETEAGMLSAADKIKLDSLGPGNLPSVVGQAQKFLQTDGVGVSWQYVNGEMTSSSLPDSVWTWTPNLGGDMFRFEPNDGEGVEWRQSVSANPNSVGSRNDNVFGFGWNLSASGVIDPTKGFIGIRIEDYFINEFGDPQSEFYLIIGPPAAVGPGRRPIAINTSQTNPNLTKMFWHTGTIQAGCGSTSPSAGGQTQLDISASQIVLQSPDGTDGFGVANDLIRILFDGGVGGNVDWSSTEMAVNLPLRMTGTRNIGIDGGNLILGAGHIELPTTVIFQNANPQIVNNGGGYLQTLTDFLIGRASDKLGFFDVAPVVQQSLSAVPTTVEIKTLLQAYGLCAP